jgi:hypothetical protein
VEREARLRVLRQQLVQIERLARDVQQRPARVPAAS